MIQISMPFPHYITNKVWKRSFCFISKSFELVGPSSFMRKPSNRKLLKKKVEIFIRFNNFNHYCIFMMAKKNRSFSNQFYYFIGFSLWLIDFKNVENENFSCGKSHLSFQFNFFTISVFKLIDFSEKFVERKWRCHWSFLWTEATSFFYRKVWWDFNDVLLEERWDWEAIGPSTKITKFNQISDFLTFRMLIKLFYYPLRIGNSIVVSLNLIKMFM